MNSLEKNCIFFLDNDPKLAAQALFDDDLKSSILYLALVVSAALKDLLPEMDWKKEGYSIYHVDLEPPSTPDVRWMESTPAIWKWCVEYFSAMCLEHEFRFGFKHPSSEILELFHGVELNVDQIDGFEPPPFDAIPEKYHVDANFRTQKVFQAKRGKGSWKSNALNTNRNLYKMYYDGESSHVTYAKREVPAFIRPPSTGEGQATIGGARPTQRARGFR